VAEAKAEKLALNMSRALGHLVLSHYGVSWQPEFTVTPLHNNDILVLASDGLVYVYLYVSVILIYLFFYQWEVMDNEAVARTTCKCFSPFIDCANQAAAALTVNSIQNGQLTVHNRESFVQEACRELIRECYLQWRLKKKNFIIDNCTALIIHFQIGNSFAISSR
jgi:hypothetical protein